MKRILLIIFIILTSATVFAQEHFVLAYDGGGQSHMNINVLSSTFDTQNLVAGDEIAVFDGTVCCGKVILTQPILIGTPSTYVTIAASMTDIGMANGYTEGNSISYKFWKASANQEVSAITADYIDPVTELSITAPTFEAFASAFVKLSYVSPVNHIPVANAGSNQSINEGVVCTLDGTASSDPDNNTLTYLWTAPSGITLSSTIASKPTFTAPEVQTNTNYTFSLVVNDGLANSAVDQVVITVKQVNKAPVANAGSDQSINEGVVCTLDGTASSDADNNTLTYLWTAPSGITLSSTTASKPTFTTPEVTTNANYTFSLVVNDGTLSSTADQVVITVKQVNKVPVANAGADQSINEGVLCTLDGTASSDADNNTLTYLWTAPSGITLSSTTASKPTFTAPEVQANTNYSITLVVNDGTASSTANQVIITVKQVNKAPVANAGSNQSINEGVVCTLDGTASSDADDNTLTYLWTAPSGITLSSATASKPTFTTPEVTTNTNYTFSLVVNDGTLSSTADQVVITVKQVNKAPVANAGPNQSINEGVLCTLDGTASSDADNNTLTYLWTAPSGITLSSTIASKPTFTAPEVLANTNYTFSLVVNDGTAGSTADQVIITVKQVNKAPVANAGSNQSINEGVLCTLDGTASSDADNNTLTYLWTAPSGITLSSATASKPTFTTPEVITNTNYTFSLVVSDGTLSSTADQVVITVKQVNKIPVANAGADQSINEGILCTLDGTASSDADNNTLTYLWTAPSEITLSSNTASKPTFTTPEVQANTNYSFTLIVNDGTANSIADQVIITVKQVNKAPVANAGSDQSILEGSVGTLDGSASSDADNDALTYLWTAPSGITLSSNTASKPTFTAPEVPNNTNYTFSLVVNDGKVNSSADQVIVTVKQQNKPPVVNAGSDQSVNEGSLVTLDGTGSSDPDSDQLTYSWTAPSGITLSSNTVSKPTFTAPEVQANTNYTFSLVVNDGTLSSAADQVVITVKQVNKAPVANAGSDQSILEGSVGTLDGIASSDADNDALTYLWTAPSGITLSSNTASKPTFTAPEVQINTNYTFSLVVNDGKVNSSADQVIVTVKQQNKPPVVNAGSDQSVNEGSLVTLDGTGSSDPDNDQLTYSWTAPSGITLSSNTASKPTFTAPEVQINTNYTFSLVVNDGTLSSSADQVIISVKQVNKAPVAHAGLDQSIDEGTVGTLNGLSSADADNDVLTFHWTAPSGITLSSITASKPTFTAPEVLANTNYTFSLVVNDGTANSVADQVVVTIRQINKAPVADAGYSQSINEGVLCTLDGTGSSDADNNTLTYLWTAPSGITLSSNTDSKPTFTAPEVLANSNYTFSLVVNDGTANSDADQVIITVKQVNKAPTANAGSNQSINEGLLVTLNGLASTDPDNDALTYLWTAPSGIILSSNTASKPTFTAPEVQANTNYTFSLVVNDGKINSVADPVVITVKQVNKLPVANAGPDQSQNEGVLVTLDGSMSNDPDNEAITYIWSAPAGITLSSNTASKPTFTSPEVQADTYYTFSLIVNDGTANSTTDQVVITVKQVNKAPVANAGTDQSVNEETLVTLDGLPSTDADNDVLTYLWSAPSGITLSSTTVSRPTFTAPEVQTNTNYTFSLIVNDGKVNSTADQIVVQVKQVNKTPVANAGTDNTYTEGKLVTLDGSLSSDPDNDLLIYSWTSPNGLVVNSSNTVNPTFTAPNVSASANYTINLMVSDGKVNSSPDAVVITVVPNRPPVANAGPDLFVKKNSLFTLDGSNSSDPDDDLLTYRWTAPSGIALTSTTDSRPAFLTPDLDTVTELIFTLIVNDGKNDSPPDQVVITIKSDNIAPVAKAGDDQSVSEVSLVTLDGSGSTDPDNDILNYTWTAPSGITLSSNTVAKPTFDAPEVTFDTDFVFSLVVNDGTVNSTADQVIVKVKQVNEPPEANAGPDQTVNEGAVVTLNGLVSSDLDNNELTYFWSAPLGITLSSLTSTNPTFTAPEVMANTYYVFSLIVNDGITNSVADQVIVTVKQINKAPVAYAGPDQTVNEGDKVTLSGIGSSDPDNNGITYLWTAPSGIILSSTQDSKPSFIAPEVPENTVFTFQLTVNDGSLNSAVDLVNINVNQVNKAPVSNAGSDQLVTEGSLVTLNGDASSDPDNNTLSYIWTAPPGITLSSDSVAKPTFTAPETVFNTDYVFTLVVNDGTVNSSADQVIVTVKHQNMSPVANAGIDQVINEGDLVALDGSASTDPENTRLTYLWTAPKNIKLSSTSDPYPSFFAPEVKKDTSFTVSLIVNDGNLNSVADHVLIQVRQVNKAPTYTSSKIFYTDVNQHFEFLLKGFDIDSDPISFTISNLPSFLTLTKSSSSSAVLSGTISEANIDNYFLTVVLSDGNLSIEETITLNILKNDHAPYVKDSIQSISVDLKSPEETIDLNTIFADDDQGDIMNFSIISNTNQQVVTAVINGTELVLSFSSDIAGSSDITISATSKGKEVTTTFHVDVKNPTGTEIQKLDPDFMVFPNPTTGIIHLNFQNTPNPDTWVSLIDPSGRIIFRKQVAQKLETINLEPYSPGIYFVRIDQTYSKTLKIVLR